METKPTLRQQIEAFVKGRFIDSSGHIDSGCYNFYDWFCSGSSLKRRSEKLFRMVIKLVPHLDIDQDKVYVFFKNNCPCVGPLYDSFSICDIETGNVLYWITPKSGHSRKAELVKAPNFGDPFFEASDSRNLIRIVKESKNRGIKV